MYERPTMKVGTIFSLALLALFAFATQLRAEDGFKSIFDGKTLDGWDGKAEFWSVKDGAITGQTTADNPTKGNTFIIWKGGELKDFELKLKFRIVGGNSGIQFRSKDLGDNVVGGYQADFDGANGWTGSLYEEKGRGILAKRGNKVEITEDGKKNNAGAATPEKEILESVKKEDWNDYTIIAKGNQLTFKVNGLTTIELTDNQASKAATSGILALQLHAGPPMTVQFKDIELKELD
jgi:hypothetical protein